MPLLIVAAVMAALITVLNAALLVFLILEARNRPRRTDG